MSFEDLKRHHHKLIELLDQFDLGQTREGISRESQARIVICGLKGSGKSTLLDQLCGWPVSASPTEPNIAFSTGEPAPLVEDFGLFCLVDLPETFVQSYSFGGPAPGGEMRPRNGYGLSDDLPPDFGRLPGWDILDPLEIAREADLILYLLNGAVEALRADHRWLGQLRRLGPPVQVVLTKSDLLEDDIAARQAGIEARLATPVLPISARTGANVWEELLPKMIRLCPHLAVALGRELPAFRRQAANHLIRRAAWINALVALEPLPLLDLPVQLITLASLLLRIAALYGQPPADLRRPELVAAIAGGLAGRYAAQQLVKLVPIVGWLASSAIGGSTTWALGRAAVAYFEAGGDAAVAQGLRRTRGGLARVIRTLFSPRRRKVKNG